MKAHMIRNTRTGQLYIEVTYPNKDTHSLWHGIIEHCAKDLTTNELKTVYSECNKQLLDTNLDDVPFNFKEMLKELQQTIINRRACTEIAVEEKPQT